MTNSIFYKRLSGSSIQGDATQVVEPAGTLVVSNDGLSLKIHDGTTAGGNHVGGIPNVISDTTPSLGGNLNTNGHQLTGTDGDLDLNGDGYMELNASTSNVDINLKTNNGVYTHLWNFNHSGELVLPNSNLIVSGQSSGETNIQIVDDTNSFKIYTHATNGAHGWDFAADGSLTIPGVLKLPATSSITDNAGVTGVAGVIIQTGDLTGATPQGAATLVGTTYTNSGWDYLQFNNGTLHDALVALNGGNASNFGAPVTWSAGSTSIDGFVYIEFIDATTFQIVPTTSTAASANVPGSWIFPLNIGGVVAVPTNIALTASAGQGSATWNFNQTGTITFPDTTVQSSAWQGYTTKDVVQVIAQDNLLRGQPLMIATITNGVIYAEALDVTEPGFIPNDYLGIAETNISAGQPGNSVRFGPVVGFNTSAFNEGDKVWASTSTAGTLYNAEPTPGYPHIIIGEVTKKSASEGSIIVRQDVRPYLNGLVDVNITNPTGGQILVFSSLTNAWVNAANIGGGGGGGGISLGDLSVSVVAPSGDGNLMYDSGTGVFTYTPANLSGFVSSSALNSYVLKSDFASSLSNYVTTTALSTDLSSYVTASTLSGYNYATQTYVTSQGYITTSALSVTTNSASGSGSLSYNNGVFTFTPAATYTLTTATNSTLGGVKIGDGLLAAGDGTVSINTGSLYVNYAATAGSATTATYVLNGYTLTTATNARLGGVIIGANMTADQYGTLTFNTSTLVNSAINVVTVGSQNANATYYPTVAGGNNNNAQQLSTVASFQINPGTGLVTVGQLSVTGSASATTSLTVKDVRDTVYTPVGTIGNGNWTPDPANGDVQTYTLTNGVLTFTGFNNPVSGQTVTFVLTQPASGAAGTWASSATIKYAGGYKTLTTTNGAVDMITISYIGTTYYASLVTNFV